MALKLGQDWGLYTCSDLSAQTTASNYTKVGNVDDLELDMGGVEVQFKSRDSSYKKYKRGQQDVSVSFTVQYDQNGTGFSTLEDAAKNGTQYDAGIADGDATSAGADVFTAGWYVTTFKPVTSIDEAGKWEVTLRISADESNAPAWNTTV